MSSHSSRAVSSSRVRQATEDSNLSKPGGDSSCNCLRLFFFCFVVSVSLIRTSHLSDPLKLKISHYYVLVYVQVIIEIRAL